MELQIIARENGRQRAQLRFDPAAVSHVNIGSLASAHLRLEGLDRVHAAIRCRAGRPTLIDLSGGMCVNGRPAHRAALEVGDRIALGCFELEVGRAEDATPTVATENIEDQNPAAQPVTTHTAATDHIPAPQTSPAICFDGGEHDTIGSRVTRECFAEAAIESRPHPRLPPERKLTAHEHTLELRLYWGQRVLDLRHYGKRNAITIGESKRADVFLSSEELPAEIFPLIRRSKDGYVLSFTESMSGEVEMGGRAQSLRQWQLTDATRDDDFHDTYNLPLQLDARVVVHHAGMTFALRFVAPARRPPRSWFNLIDHHFTPIILGSGLVHLVVLAALAVYPHDAKALDDQEEHRPVVVIELDRLGLIPATLSPPKPKPKPTAKHVATLRPADHRAPKGRERIERMRGGVGGTGQAALQQISDMISGGTPRLGDGTGLSGELVSMIRSYRPEATATLGLGGKGGIPGPPGPGVTRGDRLVRIGPLFRERGSGLPLPGSKMGARDRSPDIVIDTPLVGDSLDPRLIQEVVRNNRLQVRFCYETELQRDHELEGRVEMRWIIGPTGRVRDVTVRSSSLDNRQVERCLARRIAQWRFPPPAGGGVVEVNYPFVFRASP